MNNPFSFLFSFHNVQQVLVRLSMGQFKSKITGSGPGIHQANPEEGPPRYSSHHFDSSINPSFTISGMSRFVKC